MKQWKQRSGPVRKLLDRKELQLLDAIFKNPGIYLDEFQAVIQRVCGIECFPECDLSNREEDGTYSQRLKSMLCENQKKKGKNLWCRYKAYP